MEKNGKQMIIKQCTKLLPYDTSIYTVYAVFYNDNESIKEIDMKNDHISKEMKIHLDKNGIVSTGHEEIKNFLTVMKGASLLFCTDGTETSANVLRSIVEILEKEDTEPLILEPRNDTSIPFWEVALQYNHVVSSAAHEGFGGGIDSPVGYESLKDIVSKETYDKYALSACIDDRYLPSFWTPYSLEIEETKVEKNMDETLLI
jgi:hypothetical protein